MKRHGMIVLFALILCFLLLSACGDTPTPATEPTPTPEAVPTDTPAPTEPPETVLTENTLGSADGYDYELWKDRGDTSMTLKGEGLYACQCCQKLSRNQPSEIHAE